MRSQCLTCFVLVLALVQIPAWADGPALSVSRVVRGATSETFAVTSSVAGELMAGTLEARGVSGTVAFLDQRGQPLNKATIYDGKWPVGFVVPAPGMYRARVDVTTVEGSGSYTLELKPRSISSRTVGRHVHPRVDYESKRLRRFMADIDDGIEGAEDRFWAEIAKAGTPLVEAIDGNEQDVLVTFLWKELYETHNVLLQWPSAWTRADDYYMSHVPGTAVWYKTIRVRRGSRFSYAFSPNDVAEYREINIEHDRLNLRRAYGEEDSQHSLLELPDAPDEKWATQAPTRRGTVERGTFESKLLNDRRNTWIYTPPDYASSATPHPLVVFFNGGMSVGSGVGPTVIDNLIAEARIRPPVVCFVQHGSGGMTQRFADATATELVARVRATHRIGARAEDLVIGGFSAGGSLAAYVALKHPTVFGNVFSQSGAFRAGLPGAEPNRLAEMYIEAARAPIRFYLETGLYEPFPAATRPLDEMALEESNTVGNRHFRDVLRAKGYDVTYRETGGGHQALHWRATLADALMALLPLAKK